jgi:hypothetical protein
MRLLLTCVLAVMLIGGPHAQQSSGFCAPIAQTSARVVRVSTARSLEDVVARATRGETILVADGTYQLSRTLEISAPDVTVRGASGDRAKVIVKGQGMTQDPGVGIGINAPGVTVADLTIRDFRNHGIQVRGENGASRFSLFNVHVLDTGQQLLKASLSDKPIYADYGSVACSLFSYTDHAPSDYTNGVDALGVKGWVIRDTRFERIRGPASGRYSAGPAILMWAASEDTVVERNVVVDSFRGIALGLAAGTASAIRNGERSFDHRGGVIRNNVVVNLNAWADEAIEANAAQDVRIEHNTVLVEGGAGWSIGVRWPSAFAQVRNNLTNRQVLLRNGGRAVVAGNVIADRSWFVAPFTADMRVTPPIRPRLEVAAIPDAGADLDGKTRPSAGTASAGAFE